MRFHVAACAFGLALVCTSGLLSGSSRGDEPPPAAASAKPATVKVERGLFKLQADMKGVLEAEQTAELQLRPEAWNSPYVVEEAVAHGAKVKKGDVLVKLDTKKIDEAIQDLEVERALSELAIRLAEEELPVLEKMLPLDLKQAERNKTIADEDLSRFLEIDRPLSELTAQFMTKSAQYRLESAQEELKQLEKMYRSKDLTEETEEFILKRHRFQVEAAQFSLKTQETQRDFTLKVDLPRRDQAAREKAQNQTLAFEKAKATLPLTVNQKRLALEKLRHDHHRSAERLVKLRKDRDAMRITAPIDGIVFYGKCSSGQWPSASAMAGKLQRGGTLAPQEVFLTVVAPRPLFVRATVEEKDLHALHPDMKGTMTPAGYPDRKRPAWLGSVSLVPVAPGSFEARVSVDLGDQGQSLMPGMACTLSFVAYRKADALSVPASAVFSDDEDGKDRYVYRPGKNGKPDKTPVKTGKTSAGRIEVLEGLSQGDEILSARP